MNKKVLAQLNNDLQLILTNYSGLTVGHNNGIPNEIYGNYKVVDNNQQVLGDFDIKIIIPDKYPYDFPVLVETSEKIPRHIDRHINKKGEACVEFFHKKLLLARTGVSLTSFFKNYVNKYFCWQLLYEIEGNKNLQEWPHDEKAVFIFYSEVLHLKDIEQIKLVIQAASKGVKPSLNRECVCASGKQFKRCHVNSFNTVLSMGSNRLLTDLSLLNKITALSV